MRAKEFKSEYLYGGKCRVQSLPGYSGESRIRIEFLDQGTGKPISQRIFNLWDFRGMLFFLEDNTTHFWAEKILNYIKEQLNIQTT